MAAKRCSGFRSLPKGCIANALSLTCPKDACRLAAVASIFNSAADSDFVRERFLPSDYRDVISRSIEGADSLLAKFRSNKELYFYLSENHILIDGSTKLRMYLTGFLLLHSFSLEKESGKKCFMLGARDLFIASGDTPEYWGWISLLDSRFPEVAELINVCWFEVRGKINASMLSSGTKYSAYLVYTDKSRIQGFDHEPAEASVGISGHDGQKQSVCLDPDVSHIKLYRNAIIANRLFARYNRWWRGNVDAHHKIKYPKFRADRWMEVELGEFLVEEKQDGDMEISLMEVTDGIWKKNIFIQGIEIRPKAL
ncbi:F-box PP2-B10-like [Olea europaea subsp. europaea]|uniref:F-box PP2-B10-like n=1 Tax=Olea europaea subsp. europaea TaxID=158383 RepID=A0A8S0QSF6_OLEEU|nr:F-box PP2-B10-like [Olea europaea subsp. europaea]